MEAIYTELHDIRKTKRNLPFANEVVVYTALDGNLVICNPSIKWIKEHTMEEYAQEVVPDNIIYSIINRDILPTDRTLRNAWKIKNKKVVEDEAMAMALAVAEEEAEYENQKKIVSKIPSLVAELETAKKDKVKDIKKMSLNKLRDYKKAKDT